MHPLPDNALRAALLRQQLFAFLPNTHAVHALRACPRSACQLAVPT